MKTIQERIEAKRKELEEVTAKDKELWPKYQEAEQRMKEEFQKPWSENYNKKERLLKEVAILDGIAREMEPQTEATP